MSDKDIEIQEITENKKTSSIYDHTGKKSMYRILMPYLIFSGIGVIAASIIGFFLGNKDALGMAGIGITMIGMALGGKEFQTYLEKK